MRAPVTDHERSSPSESSGKGQPAASDGDQWARALTAAHRHWPFLVVLFLGFAVRVVTVIAYRPALLYIDSYRYLDLVRTTNPATSQTLGYVFFLWPLVKIGNLFYGTKGWLWIEEAGKKWQSYFGPKNEPGPGASTRSPENPAQLPTLKSASILSPYSSYASILPRVANARMRERRNGPCQSPT